MDSQLICDPLDRTPGRPRILCQQDAVNIRIAGLPQGRARVARIGSADPLGARPITTATLWRICSTNSLPRVRFGDRYARSCLRPSLPERKRRWTSTRRASQRSPAVASEGTGAGCCADQVVRRAYLSHDKLKPPETSAVRRIAHVQQKTTRWTNYAICWD